MESIRQILGDLVSVEQDVSFPKPFITISRQAGAGSDTLMDKLVARLRELDPAKVGWQGFDRELVEKVADENHLYEPLVASLGEKTHSWIDVLLRTMSLSGLAPTELTVYEKVTRTVRALAEKGRVVIVGRGGVFITHNLPMSVHIGLVAPVEHRIAALARQEDIAEKDAAHRVHDKDRAHKEFYHRYWREEIGPELFTAVFNTAYLSEEQIVDAIVQCVPGKLGSSV